MAANRCWSALTPATEAEVLAGLTDTLARGSVPLDHLCCELGPGCLELATAPHPAVTSADDAALLKLFTKAFFARRGQSATFMAQLGEGFPGLGGHPTLSLRSTTDGRPVLAETNGDLSKTATSAIAGVVALLPELAAMVAPTPNSYRRFTPGNWAPSSATWGIGNYSCGLRVVADRPGSTRLELRVPGADVAPHLGLAMFLGAVVWGIEGGLEPPPPVAAPVDGRLVGAPGLPRTLGEAVDLFTDSTAAAELFGERFVAHYAASRRAEDEVCRRFVSPSERHRYLADA
jgi:glutamine synthetase